jgi:uncharacterized protein YcaQ
LICFAPSSGNSVSFTAPTTWVRGKIDKPDSPDAVRAVTRRFLAAYAPCTVEDLALWWGGYGVTVGRRMLAELGEEAVEVDVEGQRAWMLARDVSGMAAAESLNTARLLPAFDPWVAGASRSNPAVLDPKYKARVYRPQGWFSPVVLVNGRMVGVWKHERNGRRVVVDIEPFGRLPAWAGAELQGEAERLADFLEGELQLEPLARA